VHQLHVSCSPNECICSVNVFSGCSGAHFEQKDHVDNCYAFPVLVHIADDGSVIA